jgi:hypothetical protein
MGISGARTTTHSRRARQQGWSFLRVKPNLPSAARGLLLKRQFSAIADLLATGPFGPSGSFDKLPVPSYISVWTEITE